MSRKKKKESAADPLEVVLEKLYARKLKLKIEIIAVTAEIKKIVGEYAQVADGKANAGT